MRQMDKIYAEARKEISKKWADYFGKAQQSIQSTEDALKEAKSKGDLEEVARLEKKLVSQKQDFVINNDRYNGLVRETTARITDANVAAMDYANAQATSKYIDGFNAEYQELKDVGIRFDMIDKNTVERRVKEGDIHLPYKEIDEKKDRRWNTKVINREVTQGIIQGESMDKIADRLFPEISKGTDINDPDVLKKNLHSAERTARTLVNAAENEGRYDRAVEMEEDGIITKKIWSAAGDDRTRDLHLYLDGQEVDVDEPFVDEDGNEMMFPGDSLHGADPSTLYNCRCAYETKVVGFRRADGSISYVDDSNFSREAHEWQIQQEKDRRAEEGDDEFEKTQNRTEPEEYDATDGLSEETKDAIIEYTMGEDFSLSQKQFNEITEAMQESSKPMYRVESIERTAASQLLDEGDDFNFSTLISESKDEEGGALRSFTKSDECLPDLLGQVDDAVIFETQGEVQHLPIEKLSQFDQAESLLFSNNWEVVEKKTTTIDGRKYMTFVISSTKKLKKR